MLQDLPKSNLKFKVFKFSPYYFLMHYGQHRNDVYVFATANMFISQT